MKFNRPVVVEPVDEPVDVPVLEPLDEPVDVPVFEPLDEPVDVPVFEPLDEPVDVPVLEPLDEPLDPPVLVPALAPPVVLCVLLAAAQTLFAQTSGELQLLFEVHAAPAPTVPGAPLQPAAIRQITDQ